MTQDGDVSDGDAQARGADGASDPGPVPFEVLDEVVGTEWPPQLEPELPRVPAAFLRRLRELTPTWRSLGLAGHTFVGYSPDDGRLFVSFGIVDEHHRVHLADYRVDVTATEWIAGQVHGCAADEPLLEHADPVDLQGGPIADPDPDRAVAPALAWVEATLRRTLFRYHRCEQQSHTAGSTVTLDRWPSPVLMWEETEEQMRALRGVWFPVYDDSHGDDAPWPGEDPPLSGAPAALLLALRTRVPTWRSLGLEPESTDARYGDGRLRVAVGLVDRELDALYGALRVELDEDEWQAGWVHPLFYGAPTFWGASPLDEVVTPTGDVEGTVTAIVDWLVAELRRPVVRRVWRSPGGEGVAHCWWDVDGGVAETILSHPPYVRLEPADADETTRLVPARQSPPSAAPSSSSSSSSSSPPRSG